MRILPDPDRPYATLKADLLRLGWVWAGEAQILPLLPGEPEWVEYRHPAGGQLRYEFNPATGHREIEADGPPPLLAALAALPRLGPADVARTLSASAIREGWERFQALRAAHPDRSALIAMMPVGDRRQVLRWMGRDLRDANANVLAAIRAGLADEDLEVRVTAALVAAKLGADGLDIREAVEGIEVPPLFADAHARAREALGGGARLRLPEPTDDATLLLHALLEPLPAVPPPRSLPRHLRADGGVIRLARSGIEVALVPSIPHWIGSSDAPERPLRLVTERAFAIGVASLDERVARATGAQEPQEPAEGPLRLTWSEASALVQRLGSLEGVAMALPSEEQWEMALRGPDGRRHPAGNLRSEPAVSPWGAAVLPAAEWVEGGMLRDGRAPTERRSAQPGERHPARFVLAFPI